MAGDMAQGDANVIAPVSNNKYYTHTQEFDNTVIHGQQGESENGEALELSSCQLCSRRAVPQIQLPPASSFFFFLAAAAAGPAAAATAAFLRLPPPPPSPARLTAGLRTAPGLAGEGPGRS